MFQIQSCCSVGSRRPQVTPERPGTPGERTHVLPPLPLVEGRGARGGVSAIRSLQGQGLPTQGAAPILPLGYLVFEVRLCTVFPLLKHIRQLVQATVVEVEDFVLALPAGNDQLAAGAGLIAERPLEAGKKKTQDYANTGFYFQV